MPAAIISSFANNFVYLPTYDDDTSGGLGADLGSGKGRCLMKDSWNA